MESGVWVKSVEELMGGNFVVTSGLVVDAGTITGAVVAKDATGVAADGADVVADC